MKSRTTHKFWQLFDALPEDVKRRAVGSYAVWRSDPSYPSLQFKRVHSREPIYSVRISSHYRALGLLDSDTVTWFWIGPHDVYDRLLKG